MFLKAKIIKTQADLIKAQDELIKDQEHLIELHLARHDALLERHIILMQHMERCGDIGETGRAKWENIRLGLQAYADRSTK